VTLLYCDMSMQCETEDVGQVLVSTCTPVKIHDVYLNSQTMVIWAMGYGLDGITSDTPVLLSPSSEDI
jgi:hypothetical protein